jgi:hypothetical protein
MLRFKVHTAASKKMAVFWVVALCNFGNVGKRLPDYNPEDSHLLICMLLVSSVVA